MKKIKEDYKGIKGIYSPRLILKAYNIEKAWIEKMEHTVGGVTQVLLFIINDYKQILDTHAVNKKDIYTYEPKENEYFLDRIRDTEDVITDYNLEPAQKLVDNWNSIWNVNEEYKAGDEITIDDKTGVIDSTFRFAEDDSLLGVWVKFGKEVKYYTLEELNDKSKNEEKEMNEDIKTEYAIINFLKKYGFATQEDLYNNIGAQVFVIDNAVKELLKQDKIKFEDGQGQDGINGWKLTEQIEEDLATLEKKVDKAEQDIQDIITSYTKNESIFSKLDKLINEAMGETQNKKVKEDKEFIDEYKVSKTIGDWVITKDFNYQYSCMVYATCKKPRLKLYLLYSVHELQRFYKREETYNDVKFNNDIPNMESLEKCLNLIGLPTSFPKDEFIKAVEEMNKDITDNYDTHWTHVTKNESMITGLNKVINIALNEGMWESPFKLDNVKEVVKLLEEPITFKKLTSKKGKDRVWNLIGDDEFWDDVEDQAYNDPDEDARPTIISHLENWIKNKKSFNKDAYSKEAETMIKKAISNFYKNK